MRNVNYSTNNLTDLVQTQPSSRLRFQYNLKRKDIIFDPEMKLKELETMLKDIFNLNDRDAIAGVLGIQTNIASPLKLVALDPALFSPSETYSLLVLKHEKDNHKYGGNIDDEKDYYLQAAVDPPEASDWSRNIEEANNDAEKDFSEERRRTITRRRRHYATTPKGGGVYRLFLPNDTADGKYRQRQHILRDDDDDNDGDDENGVVGEDDGYETILQKLMTEQPIFEVIHVNTLLEVFAPFLLRRSQYIEQKEFLDKFERLLQIEIVGATTVKDNDDEASSYLYLRHNGRLIAQEIFKLFRRRNNRVKLEHEPQKDGLIKKRWEDSSRTTLPPPSPPPPPPPPRVKIRSILAGMSFLCQGTSSTKIRAAFEIFKRRERNDDDDDDEKKMMMSFEDLSEYFGSFMKLSFAIDPNKHKGFLRSEHKTEELEQEEEEEEAGEEEKKKESMGEPLLTPEEVGYATARHCFKRSEKSETDLLDFEEFRSWFLSGGLGAQE